LNKGDEAPYAQYITSEKELLKTLSRSFNSEFGGLAE